MRIRFNLLLLPALLFSLQVCRAQVTPPPSVTFTNLGTTDGTQLWDLSGAYTLNVTLVQRNGIQQPVTLSSFGLIEDAAGNLHGVTNDYQVLTIGDTTNTYFTVSYIITGKVTGSGGAATAHFTIRMVGNGIVGSLTVNTMSAVLEVDAVPNPDDGQLEGVARFSARFSGGVEAVSGTIPQFAMTLPGNVNGTWSVTMQLVGFNSVAGTAVLTTSTGQNLGFILGGPFKNDVFNMQMRGSRGVPNTASGVGSSCKALVDATFDELLINGRLMGQRLQFASP